MKPTDRSFSNVALNHARFPNHRGRPAQYDVYACIAGPCGDTLEFWLRVEKGYIVHLGFETTGCDASVACASMAASMALNKNIHSLLTIQAGDVLKALEPFPEDHAHCAQLATNVLKEACRKAIERNN